MAHSVRLPDGRALAYAEYGDPRGMPVLYFHGAPGSRLEHPLPAGPGDLPGVRVITVDRPGYGLSDFLRGRRLLDWPEDVAALADRLGIGRFAVVGLSGGGPHAAACAYRMPNRLTRVGLVSSMAPLNRPDGTAGLGWAMRLAFTLGRRLPALLRLLIWAAHNPGRDPASFVVEGVERLPASDQAILARPEARRMLAQDFAESARQGVRGYAQDVRLFSRPWGFPLPDIAVPVHVWHGDSDAILPPGMGRYLADTIPHADAVFIPGGGHFLALDHLQEILARLVR